MTPYSISPLDSPSLPCEDDQHTLIRVADDEVSITYVCQDCGETITKEK